MTPGRGRSEEDAEQGSAAVLVAGVCAVLLVLGAIAVLVASAASASSRARTAADLSALAGATVRLHQLMGNAEGDLCSAAETVAARNGATVTFCVVDDVVNVTVGVSVAVDAGLSSLTGLPAATASARAGPATGSPGRGPPEHRQGTGGGPGTSNRHEKHRGRPRARRSSAGQCVRVGYHVCGEPAG